MDLSAWQGDASTAAGASSAGATEPEAWLFGPRLDLLLFGGSALLSVAGAWLGSWLGIGDETPGWAWLLLVVGIDVAHVWGTLYRVYFDRAELERRPALYWGTPILAFAAGVALYRGSPATFWTCLAYLAVWHFVRQQAGFMALYARREQRSKADRQLDALAVYAVTLGPIVHWHAHLPRPFWWLIEGDFVVRLPEALGAWALGLEGLIVAVWLFRQAGRWSRWRTCLLLSTALVWFCGIVLGDSDWTFTVTNVVLHGVPYLALVYRYARGRADDSEPGYELGRRLLLPGALGLLAFLGTLVGLALAEELLWEQWVWHDRPHLFGQRGLLGDASFALPFLVPALALPQLVHYLLDGFVWKGGANPSLARRLGWP